MPDELPQISFEELHRMVLELGKKLEQHLSEIEARKIISEFTPEEAEVIAKQFAAVIRSIADACSELAKCGIGYKMQFDASKGVLEVALFKFENDNG